MIRMTMVYSYYDNPHMLQEQIFNWMQYDEKMRNEVEFIITDDCSSIHPISEVFPFPKELHCRVFRITKKVPWNWLACRNIGAYYAAGKWILLTDMDHTLQPQHAAKLMSKIKAPMYSNYVYLFERIDAPNNTPFKPHNDSFLMTKDLYWKIGGYDEELSGNYGTSGHYRRRAFAIAGGNERLHIPLTRYPREVIEDASTTEFERKTENGGHKLGMHRILERKKSEKRENEIQVLSFSYEELNPWVLK
jgi:hypothetical protein